MEDRAVCSLQSERPASRQVRAPAAREPRELLCSKALPARASAFSMLARARWLPLNLISKLGF